MHMPKRPPPPPQNRVIRAVVEVNFNTSSGYESRAGQTSANSDALLFGLRECVRVLLTDGREADVQKMLNEVFDGQKWATNMKLNVQRALRDPD